MSLGLLVNNEEAYAALQEEVENCIRVELRTLEQSNEPREIYRSQGRMEQLKRLQKLREKFNARS